MDNLAINQVKYGKVSQLVDNWLEVHKGERFDLDTICRQLQAVTREGRQLVAIKLAYEVEHKKLEKNTTPHPSLYRTIDNTYKLIDWINAIDSDTLDIKFPYGVEDGSQFGFDGRVLISPGDIIVIAGVSNMGKTAFCLNMLWENMDKYPCTLMGNEYTPAKFKRRVKRMDWHSPYNEDGTPKFELIERHRDWKDIIRPNNINIIDWINLSDNFYQIGAIIEGIQEKLLNGIAVISIQKDATKDRGLGGGFSEHLASLYLTVDFERLNIIKAKEWCDFNPNGKSYGFELVNGGTKFNRIRLIEKCPHCHGKGYAMGAKCEDCQGKGWVDADKI